MVRSSGERTRWETGGRWNGGEGRGNRLKFSENYNRNSSTLHGYTRNVHRVHSSVEGCYTWSKPACTVTYIRSSPPVSLPRYPRFTPSPTPGPCLCHRMGALQPRYLHITGVRRAGNRPSKYHSPLFPPLFALYAAVTPSGFLSPADKGENPFPRILSNKNFNTTRAIPRVSDSSDDWHYEIAEFSGLKHAEQLSSTCFLHW